MLSTTTKKFLYVLMIAVFSTGVVFRTTTITMIPDILRLDEDILPPINTTSVSMKPSFDMHPPVVTIQPMEPAVPAITTYCHDLLYKKYQPMAEDILETLSTIFHEFYYYKYKRLAVDLYVKVYSSAIPHHDTTALRPRLRGQSRLLRSKNLSSSMDPAATRLSSDASLALGIHHHHSHPHFEEKEMSPPSSIYDMEPRLLRSKNLSSMDPAATRLSSDASLALGIHHHHSHPHFEEKEMRSPPSSVYEMEGYNLHQDDDDDDMRESNQEDHDSATKKSPPSFSLTRSFFDAATFVSWLVAKLYRMYKFYAKGFRIYKDSSTLYWVYKKAYYQFYKTQEDQAIPEPTSGTIKKLPPSFSLAVLFVGVATYASLLVGVRRMCKFCANVLHIYKLYFALCRGKKAYYRFYKTQEEDHAILQPTCADVKKKSPPSFILTGLFFGTATFVSLLLVAKLHPLSSFILAVFVFFGAATFVSWLVAKLRRMYKFSAKVLQIYKFSWTLYGVYKAYCRFYKRMLL